MLRTSSPTIISKCRSGESKWQSAELEWDFWAQRRSSFLIATSLRGFFLLLLGEVHVHFFSLRAVAVDSSLQSSDHRAPAVLPARREEQLWGQETVGSHAEIFVYQILQRCHMQNFVQSEFTQVNKIRMKVNV